MAGINDRVQGFLDSWPIVKEQLDRLLEEEKKDFSGDQKSDHRLPPVTSDPTLSELGLTKRESAYMTTG